MNDVLSYSNEINAVDIVQSIVQRKGLIIKFVLVTLLATLGVSLLITPTYRAATKILLRQEKLTPTNVLPEYSTEEKFLRSQGQIIQSRPVVAKALQSINLQTPNSEQPINKNLDIDEIKKSISVEFISRTNMLELMVDHHNPSLAAALANAIAKAYSDYSRDTKTKLIEEAENAVALELNLATEQLQLAEDALEKYTREEQVAILPDWEITADLKRYAGFDALITTIDSEIQKVETKLAEIRKAVRENRPEDLTLSFVINNPMVQDFQKKISDAEIKLSELQVGFTEDHPEVLSSQGTIKKLKEGLERERQKVVASEIEAAVIERKLLESRRKVVLRSNESYGSRLNKVLFSKPELSNLQYNIEAARATYKEIAYKKRNLTIFKARSKRTSDIKIIETAKVPQRPVKPNIFLNCFLALIVGVTIGSSIALLSPVPTAKVKKPELAKRLEAAKHKMGRERRGMIRTNIEAQVIYNLLNRPQVKHKCKSLDISGSGIKLISDEKLTKFSILELTINIPKLGTIFTKGEVVWVSEVSMLEDGKGPFGIGIKFVDIDATDQRRLLEFIYRNIEITRRRNV